MRFTDIFIRRPVLATVVSLLILVTGAVAALSLQIRQYPELSQTTITVTTVYPGANADVIKGFITTPIEQAVSTTEGIDTLVSTSQSNVSTVMLNLLLNANPDRATADVLAKVNQVRGVLPREANDPVVTKQTGQGFALMYLSFNSNDMNATQITDYLTRVVQPKLQTVNGVANAQILGGQTFAMRIWLDPDRMAALGVTPADVQDRAHRQQLRLGGGPGEGGAGRGAGQRPHLARHARGLLAPRGDEPGRHADPPRRRRDGVAWPAGDRTRSTVFDGLKAVFVGIYATPTANPLTVIGDVRKLVPEIARQVPSGLKVAVAYDSTEFIRASISEVEQDAGRGGADRRSS